MMPERTKTWIDLRRALRPGTSVLLAVIAGAAVIPAAAQTARVRPQRRVFVQRRPVGAPENPEERANRQEAVRLISLYLQKGIRQPHAGEQTTHLYQGMISDARQTVRYAGPGRVRMEYVSPENLKGEVILITGGRFFQYKPGPRPRILEGVATQEEMQVRVRE